MKRTAAVMLLVYVAVTVNAQSPQTLPPAPPAYGSPSTLDQAKKALDDQGLQDLIAKGGENVRLLGLTGASMLEGGIPIAVDGKIIGASAFPA
jgi:hypothetical protein